MNLKELKFSHLAKIVFVATLVVLILTRTPVWQYINAALSPVILSLVIAYMMDYAVRFIEKHIKLPRSVSIVITIILTVVILVVLGFVIIPSVVEAVSSLIRTISKINVNVDFSFLQRIDFQNVYLVQIQEGIVNALSPFLQRLTNFTGTAVLIVVTEIQKVTSGVISFFIAFVIAIYMLAEKKDLLGRVKRFVYAYFSEKQVHWIYYTAEMSNRIFKDFVLGKLLDSTIIGILSYFIFAFFHFEYALLIAIIVGITNMIPYFGPFIGAVPAAVITLIANTSDPIQVLYMLFLILIIQQLDGLVIGPFILGDSVGVSAFWIILAVTIGGATFGLVGMFLGVPTVVLVKTLIEEDVQRKLASKGYDGLEEKNIRSRKLWRSKKS